MSIPSDPKPRLRNPRRPNWDPEHPPTEPVFSEMYTRKSEGSGPNSSLFFCTCSNMKLFSASDPIPGSKKLSGCNSGFRTFEARLGDREWLVFDAPKARSKIGNLHKIYLRFLAKNALKTEVGISIFLTIFGEVELTKKMLILATSELAIRTEKCTSQGSREGGPGGHFRG